MVQSPFFAQHGLRIYWVDMLEALPPIKDGLITVTQVGDTQTLGTGSYIKKDTQLPRRETCGPCIKHPYHLDTLGGGGGQ